MPESSSRVCQGRRLYTGTEVGILGPGAWNTSSLPTVSNPLLTVAFVEAVVLWIEPPLPVMGWGMPGC